MARWTKPLHYLQEAGIEVAIFDGVEPNPKKTPTRDGLAVFRREQCDIIVTVGGGSLHDCGKASASPPPMRAICTSMPESRP